MRYFCVLYVHIFFSLPNKVDYKDLICLRFSALTVKNFSVILFILDTFLFATKIINSTLYYILKSI